MGILKNRRQDKPTKLFDPNERLHGRSFSNKKNHAEVIEAEDDIEPEEVIEIEEPDWPDDVGRPMPKRKLGKDAFVTETVAVPEIALVTPSPESTVAQDTQPVKCEKVRMTTEVSKELHDRLRMHSIKTGMNNRQIIEHWINTYTEK